jgi:predicted NBD/HSP70 family sugar kinase
LCQCFMSTVQFASIFKVETTKTGINKVLMGNRKLLRQINRNQIFNIAREERELCHRDLTQLTGLSKATVTHIIKEIRDEGFLHVVGPGQSKSGRKPTLMQFNYDARHVLSGIFFADKIQIAILNLDGKIKDRLEFETAGNESLPSVIRRFSSKAKKLMSKNGILITEVLGVGASFEGIVDGDNGRLKLSSRSGWRDVPVRELIEDELDLNAVIISDGAAMALGEHQYGVGKGYSHLVCFDVDYGIGMIELQQGRLCCGSHHMAGEIGHTTVMQNGGKCKCGKVGCLEAIASGWAILETVRKKLKDGVQSIISDHIQSPIASVAIRAVFEAAHKGDELALKVVNDAGLYLGMALAGVINYADPELVIMTGCVTHESDGMFLDIVRQYSQKYILDSGLRTLEIREGTLLNDAALIGNAASVYDEVFRAPVSYR